MSREVQLLKLLYDRFNARDMEAVLAAMHEDVMSANGMEGGHVHGFCRRLFPEFCGVTTSTRKTNRLHLTASRLP